MFNTVESLMNILCNKVSMPLFAGFGTCIRIRLMFLITFLSDMHLSDFLINVIFRASGNDKKFSNFLN